MTKTRMMKTTTRATTKTMMMRRRRMRTMRRKTRRCSRTPNFPPISLMTLTRISTGWTRLWTTSPLRTRRAKHSRMRRRSDEYCRWPRALVLPTVVTLPSRTVSHCQRAELTATENKVDLSSLIASAPGLAGASSLLPSKKENKSTSVLKGGVLAAPLPTRVQERLDREAAYEQTKQEGQKWSTLMKRVKEAEHLSFPLQATERGGVKSSGEVVATFKPENEHESAVQALLAKANLTDSGVTAAEDAALRGQDLSPEEIAARRAELRHQRELMFRAEAKAKRVAKIKSKTFRKLKRKREAKAAGDGPSLEDLERLDPEAAAEERERLDRERALERATQRHSARNRWASNAAPTDEAMEARQDMFDMRDRLRAKVHAKDGSESESFESEDDSDEEAIKTRAFDQLSKLDSKLPEVPQKKGLMQMAFMKKAEEREMKKVAEEEANLRRDLEMFGDDSDSGSDSDEAEVLKLGEGRMVFGRAAGDDKPAKAKPAAPAANGSATKARSRSPSPAVGVFGDVNPWLDGTNSGPSRKRNKLTATAETKAVGKLKKAAQVKDDDEVEISLAAPKASKATKKAEKVVPPPKAAEIKAPKSILKVKSDVSTEQAKAATSNKRRAADSGSDSDSDADLLPVVGNGPKAFTQRELVAEAFAGDNVVEDFAREKAALIEADAPQTVDTSLPGWGSWGGKGTKKRKTNPKFLKKTAGVAAEDRKDAGRANVIITEKKDKKAARFLPTDLPYPYTSVAQYEAAMAANIGSEFNSRAAFQRGTLPRVTKKPGAIVEPIRKLF